MSENATSPFIDAETETVVEPSVAPGPSQQRLSARGTDTVREEATTDDGTARTWRATTDAFEDYIMSQHAATETWSSEKGVRPTTHRFTPEYAREKTGKIHGGLRYVYEETPDALDIKTVLLTRTGWPYDADGRPCPPVDYLSGLSEGRQAAFRKLRSILDDTDDVYQWGRLTVREPHEGRRSGYPHAHDGLAIVTPDDVSTDEIERRLRPVIEQYVDANPFARPCDHGDDAVRVLSRNDGDATSTDSGTIAEALADELAYNLVGWAFDGTDPLDGVSDAQRRFASLLWATGKATVSFGETFREWVRRSQDEWSPDDSEDVEPPTVETTDDPDPVEYVQPATTDVAYEFPDASDDGTADDETPDGTTATSD